MYLIDMALHNNQHLNQHFFPKQTKIWKYRLANEFNNTIKHSFKKNTSSVNHDSRPVASFGQSYIVLYQAVAPFSPLQKSMTHKAHFQNSYDS